MAVNKIKNTYSIFIDTFISDIKKVSEVFPEKSLHAYNSSLVNVKDNFLLETSAFALRKNPNEIDNSYYRNGLLSGESLQFSLINGKLYITPGEYSILGVSNYLPPINSKEYWTNSIEDTVISLEEQSVSARISTISSGIWERTISSFKSISSPTDHGSDTIGKHIGYVFDEEDPSTLVVNNYIQKESFGNYSLTPQSANILTNAEMISVSEYVGLANGTYNQIFRTKFFPISSASLELELGNDNSLTKVIVENEGMYTYYKLFDSYIEAEESEENNACFIDRTKGKIFFSKKTVDIPENGSIVTNASISNSSAYPRLSIPFVTGKYFAEEGYLRVSEFGNEELYEDIRFRKIDNEILEIAQTINSYANAVISAASERLTRPTGKVYCYYSSVIGFQNEIKDTDKRYLSREVKPWRWEQQKTIAVLGKDKSFPYKITLKAIDIPFLGVFPTNNFTYGPVNITNDLILLEGLVTDEDDNPVPDEDVSVYIVSGAGLINGETSADLVTNDSGKFYCTYEPVKKNLSWLYFKDDDILRFGGKTKLITNPNYNSNFIVKMSGTGEESCIVYAIVKNDGSIGTVGLPIKLDKNYIETNIETKYKKIITTEGTRYENIGSKGFVIFDEITANQAFEYIKGKVALKIQGEETIAYADIVDIVSFPEAWQNIITQEIGYPELRYRLNTFFVIFSSISPTYNEETAVIEKAWLLSNNDIEFDPEKLNGKKVVISEIGGPEFKHPSIEDFAPVYTALTVSSYDRESNSFLVEKVLPESSSVSRDIDIAGYALVPRTEVLIQASAKTEENAPIYSNGVQLKIALADRDTGIVSNLLGSIKVPYGFRLWNDSSNAASTIDGETFLTLNTVPGFSFGSSKYPLISYVNSNGIIYLDPYGNQKSYRNFPSSLSLTININ